MPFLLLGGNGTVTVSTLHEACKSVVVLPLALLLASVAHHLLNSIKRCFGNNRLMYTLIGFSVKADGSVVDRVLQHALDTGNRQHVILVATQSGFCEDIGKRFERVIARGIKFKRLANHSGFRGIRIDSSGFAVIEVAQGRKSRP